MSYFHDAAVEYNGNLVRFTAEEGQMQESGAAVWYGPGEPSPWLASYIFWTAQRKLGDAPDAVVLELAAKVLGVTVDNLLSSLHWVEQYTQWHDGDPEYRILQQ